MLRVGVILASGILGVLGCAQDQAAETRYWRGIAETYELGFGIPPVQFRTGLPRVSASVGRAFHTVWHFQRFDRC